MAPRDQATQPLGIAISGAGGLIGSAAREVLEARGHDVFRLVRRTPAHPDEIQWSVDRGLEEPRNVPPLDAVIHLAGESIAGIWTQEKRRKIRHSRITGTNRLVESLSRMPSPPARFLCASAVGYYGPDRDQPAPEDTEAGEGFLADVCRDWEESAKQAKDFGARVARLRFGIVLAEEGGILDKIRLPFRLAVGGRVGSGKQWMPWVAIDDVAGAIAHAIDHRLEGPINVVAPEPVTNAELTKTLGKVLNRPTPFPVPAFLLRSVLGEMADEMLLASTRAVPGVLGQTGYGFKFRNLEQALRVILA